MADNEKVRALVALGEASGAIDMLAGYVEAATRYVEKLDRPGVAVELGPLPETEAGWQVLFDAGFELSELGRLEALLNAWLAKHVRASIDNCKIEAVQKGYLTVSPRIHVSINFAGGKKDA